MPQRRPAQQEDRTTAGEISPVHDDGVNFTRAYSHDGSAWGGDGKPLVVQLNGASARWVRLQLNAEEYLHLDEVEVIGR